MLDFRCPHSPQAIIFLKNAMLALGQRKGVLVESPRSYHYYGLELIPEEELNKFLGHALLIAPIVDGRYIAHRLTDGACRLRIGAVRNKGFTPL